MGKTKEIIFPDGLGPFVKDLEEISKIKNINILHADFITKNITMHIKSLGGEAEDVIDSINFCRLTDRMIVKSANFSTGEITVLWVPTGFARLNSLGLSDSEIDELKRGDIIKIIKSYRSRKHVGLSEAKRVIDTALEILNKEKQ